MVFVVGGLTTNILPTNEATLPIPSPAVLPVQAPTTKILPTKCLNIAEPRIFCPPKITRYTVSFCVHVMYVCGCMHTFDVWKFIAMIISDLLLSLRSLNYNLEHACMNTTNMKKLQGDCVSWLVLLIGVAQLLLVCGEGMLTYDLCQQYSLLISSTISFQLCACLSLP